MTTADQPVSTVAWVDRNELSANDWNPNKQAPPEHKLLKLSLLENGWTQPIVVREDESGALQIVDGYHRWTAAADPAIAAMTGGLVPVVRLAKCADDLARLATVRHNRARGTHYVLAMADIVADLHAEGMPKDEIQKRLGMDPEEVDRLLIRGSSTASHGGGGFNNGWKTV